MVWGELPRQWSCQGNLLRPSALCGLGLGVALIILGFGLTLAHLPCSAWCDRGRGSDYRAQVKGYKSVPLFLYTDIICGGRRRTQLTDGVVCSRHPLPMYI